MSEEKEKKHLAWTEFGHYMKKIPNRVEMDPDTVVGIARGGMPGATMLAHGLDAELEMVHATRAKKGDDWVVTMRDFPEFFDDEKVLLFDEVVDTGTTMAAVSARIEDQVDEIETASLHWSGRDDAMFGPDTWIVQEDRWVVYPWEI
jgi:hypoxanthine phosphoribosyltransferase